MTNFMFLSPKSDSSYSRPQNPRLSPAAVGTGSRKYPHPHPPRLKATFQQVSCLFLGGNGFLLVSHFGDINLSFTNVPGDIKFHKINLLDDHDVRETRLQILYFHFLPNLIFLIFFVRLLTFIVILLILFV